MRDLAALAIRLGVLPSAIEREDPGVIEEMMELLHAADGARPSIADDALDDLQRRMGG